MFNGYLELGGNEIINTERTHAYLDNQAPWFPIRRRDNVTTLHTALGDSEYESPLIDDASWVSPSEPDTHRFLGLYPLDIEGIGGSTYSATSTESLVAGGTAGAGRDGSRTIRVRGLLLGEDTLAIEAGMTWLKSALLPSQCGAHGLSCGSTDLRYFLDAPDVCDPAWSDEEVEIFIENIGTLTPATSPVIHRNKVGSETGIEAGMPSRVWWNFPKADGAIITWGAMSPNSQEVLEQSEPTVLRRTNYVKNASFETGVLDWVSDAGTAAIWVKEGGEDGGAYANISRVSSTDYRTNWIANSSFEGNAALSGWRTNSSGGIQSEVYAEAVNGEQIGVVAPSSTAGPIWAESTLLGPATATLGRASVWVGPTVDQVVLQVLDQNGALVKQSPVRGQSTQWRRISVESVTLKTGYVLRVRAAGAQALLLDAALAEDFGTAGVPVGDQIVNPYGGGGYGQGGYGTSEALYAESEVSGYGLTPYGNAPYDGVGSGSGAEIPTLEGPTDYFNGGFFGEGLESYYYLGDPLTAASRWSLSAEGTTEFSTVPLDSPFSAITASLAVRSAVGATVTIDLLSADDGAVLGTTTVYIGGDWDRFIVGAPYGRNSVLRVQASAEIDIDNVVLEAGFVAGGYFDGSTPAPNGYAVSWIGAPFTSASLMIWEGTAEVQRDDSEWRPFITALQGTIQSVSLNIAVRGQIPMDEQLERYERSYHRVSAISGPQIIKTYNLKRGAMVEVEFLLFAGQPHSYAGDRRIDFSTTLQTALYTDVTCAVPSPNALVNPALPIIPAPPRPPVIAQDGILSVNDWRRYWASVPGKDVAQWAASVPTVSITTRTQSVSQLRVRFHPNPFGYAQQEVDPCSYCAEFIVSYLPPNTTLTVSGLTQRAYAQVAGAEAVPANHLLFGTGGVPITWPELTCGIPYVMTIDFAPAMTISEIDIDLILNRRE